MEQSSHQRESSLLGYTKLSERNTNGMNRGSCMLELHLVLWRFMKIGSTLPSEIFVSLFLKQTESSDTLISAIGLSPTLLETNKNWLGSISATSSYTRGSGGNFEITAVVIGQIYFVLTHIDLDKSWDFSGQNRYLKLIHYYPVEQSVSFKK